MSIPSPRLANPLLRLTILLTALGAAQAPGTASAGQAPTAQTGAQGAPAPVVRSEEKHDVSPPLRSIVPTAVPPVGITNANPRRQFPKVLNSLNTPTVAEADPVVDRGPTSVLMPSPLVTFEGVNNVNGVLPPDTVGDIGPNHYLQMVNLSFAIYDRSGTLLYGPAATNTVWTGFGGACETTNNGDPIVVYDHLADRWLISQFGFPNTSAAGPYYECIAISQTADPTGAWYRYAFVAHATKMNDYPKFGVWPDGYYMSVNQFVSGATWGGAGVFAFERDRMLQGLSAQMVYFDLATANIDFGGLLPADLDGPAPPAGTPNYFAAADDTTFGFATDRIEVWQFDVDWTTPANSTFGLSGQPNQSLDTAPFDPNLCGTLPCVPQPGTAQRLDEISDRLMFRLQYRNFGTHSTLMLNHTVDAGDDRAGIRWYELRNGGAGWAIQQQATYAPDDSVHRWMGSIAMNANGDIALGYSASSGSTFPSIRYAGRLSGDPAGTMAQGEATMIAGAGSQTHSAARWGDYSMMSVDPSDNLSFWYTQEYYSATSSAGWRTRIGKFKMVPLPNLTINNVSATEGTSGPTNATFTVALSAASGSPVTVDYQTANGTATAGADVTTDVANSASIAIPSSGPATPYPSIITVPSGLGSLMKVTATLNGFSHTWPTDVDVLLVGPGGQSVILMSDVGSPLDATNVTFVFDDAGPALGTGTLASGTYKPTNIGPGDLWPSPAPAASETKLSVFNGLDPAGEWILFVSDDTGGDLGSFSGGWSLTFTTPGSGGDYVTKFGTATIAAGATSAPLTVVINGDMTMEPNETFFVNLSNGSNATITDSQGLGTILNDDGAVFTDATLTAQQTFIKGVHITELRTRIDAQRGRFGLGGFTWTDATLSPAGTVLIQAVHITEMRTALGAAFTLHGSPPAPPTYTDPGLAAGTTVKAIHITELRNAVILLEGS